MSSPDHNRAALDLTPAEFARLSELLDQSLDFTPARREAWLAALDLTEPKYAASIRKMFALQGECDAQEFLENSLGRGIAWSDETERSFIGRQFGPYRILRLLGNGGMGSVWLAERIDGMFARQVALKLVHSSLLGQAIGERMTREREILASLNHPHISRLLDAGIAEDGQPYLALEYVAGKPLTNYCDDLCLSVHERLGLFQQVLSAVQYAHAHLVIHRDLKPSNILVTGEGQVHLLDFGIAKLVVAGVAHETELTQLGGRPLTLQYAAPEQIASGSITTAVDVYSLGVMLYDLLTGERPYRLKRESRGALEEAILQADPVPPSRMVLSEAAAHYRGTSTGKLAKILRGDLDTIVLKALKKSPADRYATANAFAEDIRRFLADEVVLAQRDNLAYVVLKFANRHRLGIGAAGVVLALLAGGLAATTYEAKVASSQRDVAQQAQLRSLTQTAAARLLNADVPAAMGIILEVLPHRGVTRPYTSEALSVFQQARALDPQILAITGHQNRVRSVAFSPDGRRVVTASWDKTARVWDAATGRQTLQLNGHTDRVWSAFFSPDGKFIVTASHDKTARVWDASTGKQLLSLNHGDRVTFASYSPDGNRIVTSSYDKTARVWDVATGQQLLLLSGHTEMVMSAAFSPDGKQIVTSSHDKTVRIWDARTGRQVQLLTGHTDWVVGASFSPDNHYLLTASFDKTAVLWDAATSLPIRQFSGHTDRVSYADFSADGRRVVTTSYDKTARIWDTATGRELLRLNGHTSEVMGAAWAPDGKHLFTASYDATLRYWDAAIGRETLLLSGHSEPVASAAFSPDGSRVVTGSYDKTARIWDANTGQELTRLIGHTDQVVGVAFSPDGKRVVTASPDKTARIWDAATGRELLQLAGHTDQVVGVAFSPDGSRVVTASLDKTARIWDAVTGKELLALKGHTDLVETADFSADGKRIVTASQDKTARIWDAATGRELAVLSGHTERLEAAAFSPDGRRIVTASADKTARIWDVSTGRELVLLSGHSDLVEIAAFSSDGKHVVTASDDKTARVWDAATGQEMLVLSGHTDRLWYAAFSRDGMRVVTASDDRTARIWDAHSPSLDVQIGWAEAAQFDQLSTVERFQLGLPPPTDVRQWPPNASTCDQTAAAPYDPQRRASGVAPDKIVSDVALAACDNDLRSADGARSLYQRGRAEIAATQYALARRDFEAAVAQGYSAARIDLAALLTQPSAAMMDVPRALALYQQAWNNGTTVAGYQLGRLYEDGIAHDNSAPAGSTKYSLPSDETVAWAWYQKAALAHEPNALARFAVRNESTAATAPDLPQQTAYRLEAFRFYAAAADAARREDWPDDTWMSWRYRRASLARLLARDGLMQPVAETYATVGSDKQ